MNDPKNWNAVEWGSFDVGSPVFAKEIEKRWNAYPGLVAAMRKIAKPALGGKQQQYMAQAILRKLGEHDGDSRD